jgi:uncharacterized membrane protein
MQSTNTIEIAGDLDEIVAMAAAVEYWPEILPHYRWVTVLDGSGDRRTVEMAARRDWIPVKWQAVQEIKRDGLTPVIAFKHVRGVTTGMDVAWTFEPLPDRVKVQIWHGFDPPWPIVGNLVADHIIGPQFVHAIAGKTLATIKMRIERGERARTGGTL